MEGGEAYRGSVCPGLYRLLPIPEEIMHREQKHHQRCPGENLGPGKTVALGWIFVSLLALTVAFLPPTGVPAAHAKTEAAKEQVDSEQADSEQATNEESDAADSEEDEKEATEEKAEEPDKKEPAEEEPKEEAKSPAQEEKPKDDSEVLVETERTEEMEVDPPQKEVAKNGEARDSAEKPPGKKKCIIGATATLLEKQSELKFRARVDSGAKSCSLHYEKLKIEDESQKEDIVERMTENIGKVIRFEVKNGDDKTHILTSKIAGYVIIKNSNKEAGKRRYKVPLTFRWKAMEKEVLVTLNKRGHMDYPLLLGRNFLRGDFLVDVEMDSDD